MDKYEYRAKTEQMLAYAEQKSYQKAMSIADTIDWRKVKNTAMLSTVSEIYENAGELGKARDTLFIAYDKAPSSRKVVYRLGIISLKLGHFDEAADCYEKFVKLAPKDPNQYILRYKILKAQKAPVKEQIEALEDFKHSEYVEKWAYELARLYAEAGMTSECLDECDDLILWFSEGTYVYQAMELKMKYKPLTPLQQEKYDHRNDGTGRKDSSKRKPSFRKSKERPAPDPRIADKIRKDVHVTDSIDLPDLPEPMTRTHASEPEAESQPKTRIRSTSDISTTISGASLSDALKAGVAVASGAVAPESVSDDSQMTGKMKIEEILANWEATQRENAKILEKSQEEAEKEKALREKKREKEEVLGATKPILSDDIRKLMEQLENGEEPEITDEDAEDFVDDEDAEETESPEDSSKEASDTDDEDLEEEDFEEIVDSEEDDESDAVYDEEAEYEDEDDSEYDDDEEYEDEDDSEDDNDEEYEDEDDSEYDDDEEYEDEDDSEYDEDEEYEDEDSEYDDEEEYEDEDDSEYDDDEEYEDEDDSEYDEDEEYEDEDDSEYDDDEEYEDEDDSEYDDDEEYEDEDDSEYDDDEEYEDEDDSEYDDDEEYEDEDDSEYDDEEEYEDEDDSEYDDEDEYEDEDDSEYDDEDEYEDDEDSEYDDDEEYEDEDDSEYDDDEEYEDEDDSEYDDEEEYEDEDDFEYDDDEDEDDYQIDDELDEDHKEDFDFEKESDLDDNASDEDDSDFADLDSFEDEEELDSSDDYLDLEFDEEPTPAPEPKKETSKSEPTPDIDEVLEIEEPSEDEITERMGKFDTGFVVQGRYDLSATSEIGLKLGLTEEQKQLFSYFVPIRGVSEQLVEVLDNDKRCRNRYGTSRTGNILILGRKGSGKTVLAVDIVKAIQKQRRLKQGKVAIVTGDSLNKKDIGSIIDKLNGGALIIEKASKMNDRTIRELNDMMDEQTGELLFLLEDQKKPLERMFASHREFKRKFTSRLELPVFINDELVTFGQTYAKENGYRIDEMGILALYSRIDMMQREDHAVTVAEVKEIMDEAISHSQKANVKHLVKRVFGRSTDNSDHIILKEEDFKA